MPVDHTFIFAIKDIHGTPEAPIAVMYDPGDEFDLSVAHRIPDLNEYAPYDIRSRVLWQGQTPFTPWYPAHEFPHTNIDLLGNPFLRPQVQFSPDFQMNFLPGFCLEPRMQRNRYTLHYFAEHRDACRAFEQQTYDKEGNLCGIDIINYRQGLPTRIDLMQYEERLPRHLWHVAFSRVFHTGHIPQPIEYELHTGRIHLEYDVLDDPPKPNYTNERW
jgi:hypothetical protein